MPSKFASVFLAIGSGRLLSANRSTVGGGTGVDVDVGRGLRVGVRVAAGRGVFFTIGVLARGGEIVTAGVLDAVGALAVSVAKIFIAILASVALASGVGGDSTGSPIDVHAAKERLEKDSISVNNHLCMETSLKKDF
jgi:hypothetical protein